MVLVLFLFGLSLWSALAIAFLIACPLMVAWVLVTQRGMPDSRSNGRST